MSDHKELNKDQIAAITYGDGPLLIIAGAGTGKTTVITERIKHLIIDKKIPTSQVLALTFTDKAAYEMQERVDILLPYGYTDLWIHTFHSFCDRILRTEAAVLGLDRNYQLISKSEALLLLKQNISSLKLKIYKPKSNPLGFLSDLYDHFSRLKDEDITPQDYLQWAKSLETSDRKDEYLELASVYEIYEELKVTNSVMDFSDLLSYTLLLFRTKKHILEKYQKQFKYILVDEFQDTNYSQNELAILLTGEQQNITVVADDDQAIYRFRGAAVSNVLQFKKNFPKSQVISLINNYRSTQTILNSAYNLIQHNNPNRLEIIEHIDKKLKNPSSQNGEKIKILHAIDSTYEADMIVKEIEKLLKKGYNYNDFAILVRANNHAQSVIASLQRQNIPYQFLGPEYLFQQEEIKDLIAYLLFLTNLSDSVALFRVLSMNVFKISAIELNYLLNSAKTNNLTLFESLNSLDQQFLSETSQKTLSNFKNMVTKHLEQSRRQNTWNILYNFIVDSGFIKLLNPTNIISADQEKAVLNIGKFFEKIKKFESNRIDKSIYTVAEWLTLMLQVGDSPRADDANQNDNAINIVTVHSAKGLEFKVVFLMNLVSDRFPSRDRAERLPIPEELIKETMDGDRDYHLEEERRLFYVGITRAKERLYFTWANFYGEGKRIKKISPFIKEALPEHTLDNDTKGDLSKLPIDALFEYRQVEEEKSHVGKYKVKKITFSNIQTFNVCPLHYKAQVIFNIPTPPTANQSVGIAIHKTLYEFYKKVQEDVKLSKKDLIKLLHDNWTREGFVDKKDEEENLDKAIELLEKFYEKECKIPTKPLALELPFSFTLKNGVKVSGKIDRIDKTNEGIEIIDYKTGEYTKKADKPHQDQLAMYALAATKIKDKNLNHLPENMTLTIYFLNGNERKQIVLTHDHLEKYENELTETIKKIENSDFSCSKSPRCASCEFFMLCNTANI